MIGHLGSRASALLDGQLSPEETERAWAHVHACHVCRDLVEHEGWVKTRLSLLSHGHGHEAAPAHLKGSLLGCRPAASSPLLPSPLPAPVLAGDRSRRGLGMVAFGGPAVGVAVMGVLALGAAPADAPSTDRRAPVTSITQPASVPGSPATRRSDLP